MPKRVSLKGKGADLFFGNYAPVEGEDATSESVARPDNRDQPPAESSASPGRTPAGATARAAESARPQVGKSTSIQVEKRTRGPVGEPAQPLVVKYTTHLRPATIKALKRVAFESERKDYEIVQEALDAYLKRQPRS